MTTVPLQYSWRGLAAVAGLSIIQLFAVPPAAADYDVGAIHIAQPWARATPKGSYAHPFYHRLLKIFRGRPRGNWCLLSALPAPRAIRRTTKGQARPS
jgi:hypothetical protein